MLLAGGGILILLFIYQFLIRFHYLHAPSADQRIFLDAALQYVVMLMLVLAEFYALAPNLAVFSY